MASLNHLRAVQRLITLHRGQGRIDPANYVLEVRVRNRVYSFFPQFLCEKDGKAHYSVKVEDDVRGFIGWLPYFNKRWPTGAGKRPFKEFCAANGLPTPRTWSAPADDLRDFLIKHESSSFGHGMRGPFRQFDRANTAHQLRPGEYYEAFLRGRILKAFYWDGRPTYVEMLDMPTVQGDGKSTLRELLSPKLGFRTPPNEWQTLAEIAAYSELSMDGAPREGQIALVDFRYGSCLHPTNLDNPNVLSRMRGTAIIEQVVAHGQALWRSIPEAQRESTLFSVDAIADAQDRVWLLEMNCNPVCPPETYTPMFEKLFGPPPEEAAHDPAQPTLAPTAMPGWWAHAPAAQHASTMTMPVQSGQIPSPRLS